MKAEKFSGYKGIGGFIPNIAIPNPPSFINDQQFANSEECLKIISTIFERNKIVSFPEMRKVDIMNETLEEKLDN